MNTFSIVVIVFILICMILGYRRGFVRSILKIVFTGLSLLLAYFLAPMVGNILMNKTQIDDVVEEKIYSFIEAEAEKQVKEELEESLDDYVSEGFTDGISEDVMNSLVEAVLNKEPSKEEQEELINSLDSPQFIKDMLLSNNNQATKEQLGATTFYTYVSSYIAYMVTNAVAFFATFAIMVLLFNVIMLIANVAASLPVINTINRLCGMLLGGCEAVLIVWIVFAVIMVAANTEVGESLANQISESPILRVLSDNNIFNSLIKNITKV